LQKHDKRSRHNKHEGGYHSLDNENGQYSGKELPETEDPRMLPRKLSLIFGNIRGLFPENNLTKINILNDMTRYYDANMIIVTESHLNEYISSKELNISDWTLHRADRTNGFGGRVAIYLKNDIIFTDKFTFSNDYCEIIGIYIPKQNYINITIYRPPGCPTDKFNEIIQMSDNWINGIERKMGNPIININGDFNFPNMCKWTDDLLNEFIDNHEDRKSKGLKISEVNTQTLILYEFLNSQFLSQLVNSNTR